MIALDIISDPVCPWCYIGKTKLDRALERVGRNPFDIAWRMFRLNPDMPAEGMDRRAYLEAKFGGPAGAQRVYGAIADAGRAAGLEMRLDEIPKAPQTIDAHRLVHWSRAAGAQTAVVDGLFDRYFNRCEDISDPEVLADVAESAGMERDVVERLLAGDSDRDALTGEEAEARRMGVSGVPCFIINRQYVLQGAQETDTWVRVIEEIEDALDKAERD